MRAVRERLEFEEKVCESLLSPQPLLGPGDGKCFNAHRRYAEYVLTTPYGTAEHNTSVVGRVNLKRLRRWVDNTRSTFSTQ